MNAIADTADLKSWEWQLLEVVAVDTRFFIEVTGVNVRSHSRFAFEKSLVPIDSFVKRVLHFRF